MTYLKEPGISHIDLNADENVGWEANNPVCMREVYEWVKNLLIETALY